MNQVLEILSIFDSRTIMLLVCITLFVQTGAVGSQAYFLKEYKGLVEALFGSLSLAVGFSLLLFRDILPDLVTIVLANTLIVTTPLLYYVAISRFGGQPYNLTYIIFCIGVTAFLLFYFSLITDNFQARVIIISLFSAINLLLVFDKIRKVQKNIYEINSSLAASSLLIYGGFLLIRAVSTWIYPPQSLFANSPLQSGTYILIMLVNYLWIIGFILMGSQRLQIDLVKLASMDHLTRISNRRATQEFMEKELSLAHRTNNHFSILLIDFDNFKDINDTHGHTVGDHVLIKSAQIFKSNIRKEDLVGRWGGEEFLLILPRTSTQQAVTLANRLLEQIQNEKYSHTLDVPTTISIGIASSEGLQTMDDILREADLALYDAKVTKNSAKIAETASLMEKTPANKPL